MNKILKGILLLGFCLSAAGVAAGQWGASSGYAVPEQDQKNSFSQQDLMKRILEGKTVHVGLYSKNKSDESWNYYAPLIAKTYNEWFSYPAKLIRQRGREEEFADILPILDKGVDVKITSDDEKINIFLFTIPIEDVQKLCEEDVRGCYIYREYDRPVIAVKESKFVKGVPVKDTRFKRTLTHEIGHSLGLADQYIGTDFFRTHSVYSSYDTTKSVMNLEKNMTCDDADGIINLIDIVRGSSRGDEKGWRSLCKGSQIYYKKGVPEGKSPYTIKRTQDGQFWYVDRYEDGKQAERKKFSDKIKGNFSPFRQLSIEKIEKDNLGRPVYIKGLEGEEIYYSYNYNDRIVLVTRGGKLLLKEKVSMFPVSFRNKDKKQIYFNSEFGEDGTEISKLQYYRLLSDKDQSGNLRYTKGISREKPLLQIDLVFDFKGNIVHKSIQADDAFVTRDKKDLWDTYVQAKMVERKVEELTEWYLKNTSKDPLF